MQAKLTLLFVIAAQPAQADWSSFFSRLKGKPAAAAEAPQAMSRVGQLEVQLVEGGLAQHPKSGLYYPSARLTFKNLDLKRKFHRTVVVEFLEASSLRPLASSKTFLSLKPEQGLSRLYGSARRLGYATWEEAPAMLLRVKVGKLRTEALPLPRGQAQADGPGPGK